MTRHIALTIDYEIFGNGTGDVRQHIILPTARMAAAAERYNLPLTVYVEVEEYLAFERNATALCSQLGYDPARLIRDQVKELSRRGHDIQLHLHPEWYGATLQNGLWQLDLSKRTVDSLFDTQEETDAYIAARKAVLEDMMDASGRQSVVAYRAGAFSAQPGVRLLPALATNGFLLDSSVVKGLIRENGFDYRQAPSTKDPWRVSNNVSRSDNAGSLWEVPIYSKLGRRFQQATWARLTAKFSSNVPRQQQRAMVRQLGLRRSPWQSLKFLLQPAPIKLDFHNLSPQALLRWVRSAPPPSSGLPDVLVAIGHSKEHVNDRAFFRLMDLLSSNSGIQVVSLSKLAGLLPATVAPRQSVTARK